MFIYLTSFAAGTLAAFSPCVLPVLPLIAGSSTSESKKGPLFLSLGLIGSLTIMGLIFNLVTSLFGLDESHIRILSAIMLISFGIILLMPALKEKLLMFLNPIANQSIGISRQFDKKGVWGQFAIGFLLGLGWSPCVGPTLGIAMTMASSGNQGIQAALLMILFGLGLSMPLLGVAYGLRSYLQKKRDLLMKINLYGNKVVGFSATLIGLLILTSGDKKIEAYLVTVLPEWYLKIGTLL